MKIGKLDFQDLFNLVGFVFIIILIVGIILFGSVKLLSNNNIYEREGALTNNEIPQTPDYVDISKIENQNRFVELKSKCIPLNDCNVFPGDTVDTLKYKLKNIYSGIYTLTSCTDTLDICSKDAEEMGFYDLQELAETKLSENPELRKAFQKI